MKLRQPLQRHQADGGQPRGRHINRAYPRPHGRRAGGGMGGMGGSISGAGGRGGTTGSRRRGWTAATGRRGAGGRGGTHRSGWQPAARRAAAERAARRTMGCKTKPVDAAERQWAPRTDRAALGNTYGTTTTSGRTDDSGNIADGRQGALLRAQGGVHLRHHSLRHVPVGARHEPRRDSEACSRTRRPRSTAPPDEPPHPDELHGAGSSVAGLPNDESRFLFAVQQWFFTQQADEPQRLEELVRRLRQQPARLHRRPVRDRGARDPARARQHARR